MDTIALALAKKYTDKKTEYELINRITIDSDDVKVAAINADENGNTFELQEVALRISSPVHTVKSDANVFLYSTVPGSGRILGFSEQIANTSAFELRLWAKKCPYGYEAKKASNTNAVYNLIDNHASSFDFVRCVIIELYSNTFANGTVIELWGVRA